MPEFFGGQHQGVACAGLPRGRGRQARRRGPGVPVDGWTFKNLPTDLRVVPPGRAPRPGGHRVRDVPQRRQREVRAGEVQPRQGGVHADRPPRDASSAAKCHKPETGTFPAGARDGRAPEGRARPPARPATRTSTSASSAPPCESCHTPASFKVPAFTHANQAAFFTGKHATQPCAACHKPAAAAYPGGRGTTVRYKGLTACASLPHGRALAGRSDRACEGCHTPEGWAGASRAFHKTSRFPLEGRHLAVAVRQRATSTARSRARRTGATTATGSGGRTTRTRRASAPTARPATGRSAGPRCSWNHGAATGMPLSPAHRALGCDSCHTNRRFDAGSPSCYSCHAKEYQATTQPTHAGRGLPDAVRALPQPSHTSFSQATFEHSAYFPLAGVHATQACAACHKNNVYKGTPRDCYGCHQTDYERTDQSRITRRPASRPRASRATGRRTRAGRRTFNHSSVYPLVGVHATQACTACHKNNVYKGTPRDCYGCHRTDYERTDQPESRGGRASRRPASRATGRRTRAGRRRSTTAASSRSSASHATQACTACHKNNVYKGTPRDCFGCHRTELRAHDEPEPRGGRLPDHVRVVPPARRTPSWRATFNHSRVFAAGRRRTPTQACTACHKNNVYKGTPRDCYGCHRTNYERTTSPNHAAAGFPTTCESCHSASSSTWSASFNHNRFFVLAGRHLTAACSSCHKNNVYRGTPRDCYPCHQAQYDRTTNPNHRAAGFPTTCESVPQEHRHVVQPGPVQPHVVPDHVRQARRAGVLRSATRTRTTTRCSPAPTCHTRATTDSKHSGPARATGTTRPPATRATRRGEATRGAPCTRRPLIVRRRPRVLLLGCTPPSAAGGPQAQSPGARRRVAPPAAGRRSPSSSPALGPRLVLRPGRVDDRRRRLVLVVQRNRHERRPPSRCSTPATGSSTASTPGSAPTRRPTTGIPRASVYDAFVAQRLMDGRVCS